MTTTKKKRKVMGRPVGAHGVPQPGSGKHPADKAWKAKGYLTVKEAAKAAGLSYGGFYKRLCDGRLNEGVDFHRVGDKAVIYVAAHAAERIKAAGMPPVGQ